MIVKYVKGNQLSKVNQIEIIDVRGSGGGRRSDILKPVLSFIIGIVFAFLLISFSSESVVATSEPEKPVEVEKPDIRELSAERDSARALRERNIATAPGVARITENTAQGRLLARRGALIDASRNLLILRQKLLNMPGDAGHSVSGRIVGLRIHSERVENNLYFLQVEMPLDKLMEGEMEIERN